MVLPPGASLIKYDTPIVVAMVNSGKKTRKPLPPIQKATTKSEDLLNAILPPKEFIENGLQKIQYVSATPATRVDVINLQEDLETKLTERGARETGICAIREELYSQSFDEIIRQITINCTERGLMLVRVRDELRMVVSTYNRLYESAIAFGMRKALQADQRKSDMVNKIKELEQTCIDLEKEIETLHIQIENTSKKDEEDTRKDEKNHLDKVQSYKENLLSYKKQTDALLETPSKS